MYRNFRVYCGPCLVHALAEFFRMQKVEVTCEGTEHVYVKTDLNDVGLYRTAKQLLTTLRFPDVQPTRN